MKALSLALIGCLLASSGHAMGNEPLPRATPESVGISSERLALIRRRLDVEIARDRLPGGVLAIARRGKLVHFEAYGYLDKSKSIPMHTDAIFNLASLTKPMTAVAALQLFEMAKLPMNDPLPKFFPQFARQQVAVMDATQDKVVGHVPPERAITVQDLFRHTSGLVYGNRGGTAVHRSYPSVITQASMTRAEFIDVLSSLPLPHHPGKVWRYGFGLDVLGLIIEQISEQTLGQYMQANMWKPLGMTDTHFGIPGDKADRYAKALPIDPATGRPQTLRPPIGPTGFECGGACVASTASDYMRFALMLLNKGTFNNRRILGRKTVEYMTSNHLGSDVENLIGQTGDPTRADWGFGLGVAVRTSPGIARTMGSVGEFAWPGAHGSNWWADPREELVVVWMAHSPGEIRWEYRQLISALVYQALLD